MGAYTIETWLAGMVDLDISETTLKSILFNNNIVVGTPAASCSEMQRELCLADLYMWVSQSSTASTGEYESDGGWQHQRSAKNVADRNAFRARANELYKKWGSDKANSSSVGSIVVRDIY